MKEDRWLAERLGRSVFTWEKDDNIFDLVTYANQHKPSFIQAKVVTNDILTISELEKAGFSLIDTSITLEINVESFQSERKERKVDVALQVQEVGEGLDNESLLNIAANNLQNSRFHLDPKITNTTASFIKKDWLQSYLDKKRGDTILVAVTEGVVVGFLAVIIPKSLTRIIDLIAVDSDWRKRGFGEAMVKTVIEKSSPGTFIEVGTQVSNISSLRFYESLGFKVRDTHYVFHMHT